MSRVSIHCSIGESLKYTSSPRLSAVSCMEPLNSQNSRGRRRAVPRRAASRRVVSCRVAPCRAVSCRAVPCRVASRRVVSCKVTGKNFTGAQDFYVTSADKRVSCYLKLS
jgi:hypothetical protein